LKETPIQSIYIENTFEEDSIERFRKLWQEQISKEVAWKIPIFIVRPEPVRKRCFKKFRLIRIANVEL
jgi:hypothetical protein